MPVPKEKPAALRTDAVKTPPYKPLIVIDAGHGGVDPGATSHKGHHEKHLTLRYAKALRHALLRTGLYRVLLTRGDDRFLLLRKRVDIARRNKGDIFISLHADSAPSQDARGLSVYTLSAKASDEVAAALADRENKVDILAGLDITTEHAEVADILFDLVQRDTKARSTQLAQTVLSNLQDKVRLLPNPHRQAGFAVLKAPDIPSILIEMGFLSNRHDERLLRTAAHQQKLVDGIVRGIGAYMRNIYFTHKP